ncbi:MAG: hypothetical protein IH822_05330 [Chloroflexi bacterium]|nr:hypothetical protein [Chloroflexota bacterium]
MANNLAVISHPTPTPTPTSTSTPTPTATSTSTPTPTSTSTSTPTPTSTATEADIDIKPGGDPNSISVTSQGLIPVAILSTASFDATTVAGTTVQFGPAAASPKHDQSDSVLVADHQRDVNGDSLTDYVLHFRTGLTGISEGDTEACLTGQTFGGIAIEGCDAVRIVPPWLDSDGDGFGDAVEATLTTDQFAACPTDASHDANPADINNDTFVDITDIAAVAAWFGQEAPLALPRYDVKPDGFVDITDIVAVAALFGQSCTP